MGQTWTCHLPMLPAQHSPRLQNDVHGPQISEDITVTSPLYILLLYNKGSDCPTPAEQYLGAGREDESAWKKRRIRALHEIRNAPDDLHATCRSPNSVAVEKELPRQLFVAVA